MRTSFSFLIASTLAAAAAILPVAASAQGHGSPGSSTQKDRNDPTRLVTRVHQADLVALVLARGDTIVSQQEKGEVSINGKAADGLPYVMIGTACDLPDYGPGCLAIEFQVRYPANDRVTLEAINEANLMYRAAKVTVGPNEDGDMRVFVTYYAIVDEGQTFGNLSTILLNMLSLGPNVSKVIWP